MSSTTGEGHPVVDCRCLITLFAFKAFRCFAAAYLASPSVALEDIVYANCLVGEAQQATPLAPPLAVQLPRTPSCIALSLFSERICARIRARLSSFPQLAIKRFSATPAPTKSVKFAVRCRLRQVLGMDQHCFGELRHAGCASYRGCARSMCGVAFT
jgi:hypothetical protein